MSRHSRTALKELGWILITWCVFCAWVVLVCAPNYQSATPTNVGIEASGTESPGVDMVLGLPSWVFWGIAVPWASATLASILFATFGLKDDTAPEDSHE